MFSSQSELPEIELMFEMYLDTTLAELVRRMFVKRAGENLKTKRASDASMNTLWLRVAANNKRPWPPCTNRSIPQRTAAKRIRKTREKLRLPFRSNG